MSKTGPLVSQNIAQDNDWTGSEPVAQAQAYRRRLYLTTIENPRPEAAVRSLDYVSAKSGQWVLAAHKTMLAAHRGTLNACQMTPGCGFPDLPSIQLVQPPRDPRNLRFSADFL